MNDIPEHAETLAWFLYTGIAERDEALAETATALRTNAVIPDGMDRIEFGQFVADLDVQWQDDSAVEQAQMEAVTTEEEST